MSPGSAHLERIVIVSLPQTITWVIPLVSFVIGEWPATALRGA